MPTPPPPVQFGPDPLHTFSTDFADRIDREQASAFSVLAAQQDAAKRTPAEPRERRSFIPVVLATLLIVVGIGGITAAYLLTERDPVQKTLGVPSLIFADEKMELEGPDYRQALADATNEPLVEGNVLVTYITSASTTDPGFMREPQLGGVLIRALNLGAPDILLRNVDLTSTVGIIHAGTETRPFFILRVNSYERTFAGMLGWENRMLADLAPLYPAYTDLVPLSTPDPVPGPAASTTPATISGTSTQASTASPALPNLLGTAPSEFQDFVVVNRDVRALKDRFGRTLVLYGYADAQTLIVARDEAAFAALVARLAAATATN